MLDLLELIVRESVIIYDWLSAPVRADCPAEAPVVWVMGIEPAAPPRFEVTLKLSMPVMCILSVEGLPVIMTWPLFPLMALPLLPIRGFLAL